MLAGPGFGDDARLAHVLRQEHLAEGVVDLVRARVGQVLAFEVHLCPAKVFRQAFREIQGRWSADVIPAVSVQCFLKDGVVGRRPKRFLEFFQGVHKRLGNVFSAVRAITPPRVRIRIRRLGRCG